MRTLLEMRRLLRCWAGSCLAIAAALGPHAGCSDDSSVGGEAGAAGASGASGAAGEAGAAGAGTAGSGGEAAGAAQGDPSVLVGSFQVRLVAPNDGTSGAASPGSTTVLGKVYDGATPSAVVWETKLEEGGCVLSTPRVPFCGTPCGGSAVCTEDDTCTPYPTARGLGAVTLAGLKTEEGASTFDLKAVANSYQPPSTVKLAYPPFAEGDAVTVASGGEFFAAFSLEARGVAPLELTSTSFALEKGKPLALAWVAAGAPASSTIRVKLDLSHHGGTRGQVECEAPDSGSFEVPASMISMLLDLGVAGFPSVIVTRRSVGSAVIAAGRVDLVVSSDLERQVTVPGLTSCSDDSQCPDGQTCQSDLTCK